MGVCLLGPLDLTPVKSQACLLEQGGATSSFAQGWGSKLCAEAHGLPFAEIEMNMFIFSCWFYRESTSRLEMCLCVPGVEKPNGNFDVWKEALELNGVKLDLGRDPELPEGKAEQWLTRLGSNPKHAARVPWNPPTLCCMLPRDVRTLALANE